MPRNPFARAVHVLYFGEQSVLHVSSPRREESAAGMVARREEENPHGDGLKTLAQSLRPGARFVTTHLDPAYVNHVTAERTGDEDDLSTWIEEQRQAVLPPDADPSAYRVAYAPADPAGRRYVFAWCPAHVVDRHVQRLQGAGFTPVRLLSLAHTVGYAFSLDPYFAARPQTVVWERGFRARFSEGYPAEVERFSGTPESGALIVPREDNAQARQGPEVALVRCAQYPGLPQLDFLGAEEKRTARIAVEERVARRAIAAVWACFAALALITTGLSFHAQHQVELAREALSLRAPEREALVAQERELARLESARQAFARQVALRSRLTEATSIASRARSAGLAFTRVQARADGESVRRVEVRGLAQSSSHLTAYLDRLRAEPLVASASLVSAQQSRTSPGMYGFDLLVEFKPLTTPLTSAP